jgi:hypothetical protein
VKRLARRRKGMRKSTRMLAPTVSAASTPILPLRYREKPPSYDSKTIEGRLPDHGRLRVKLIGSRGAKVPPG